MAEFNAEDMGELKSDIKYIVKAVDQTSKDLKEDRDTNRIAHGELHKKINVNQSDIAKIKGIGITLSIIWTTVLGWVGLK